MFLPIVLDYDFAKILVADHDTHTAYDGKSQIRTYCEQNTTIHQLYWSSDQLDFERLGAMLDMEVITVSSIRQDPGNVMPYHRDTFYKIRERIPNCTGHCVRANIFLEDSRLGHMIQFTLDNRHYAVTEWKANTGFMFDSTIFHLSCNAGLEPKYTLQISGFYLGQEQ